MAIVKQTLHPEGDTGTDIYPKTSADQIADLPQSSKSQLYAHFVSIRSAANQNTRIVLYFVNSIAAPANSAEALSTMFRYQAACHGFFTDGTRSFDAVAWYYPTPEDRTVWVGYKDANNQYAAQQAQNIIQDFSSLVYTDTVAALGSNAG